MGELESLQTLSARSAMPQVKGRLHPGLIQLCAGNLHVPIDPGIKRYNALNRHDMGTRMLVVPHLPSELTTSNLPELLSQPRAPP